MNIPSQYPIFSEKLKFIEYVLLAFVLLIAFACLSLESAHTELVFSIFAIITIPITIYAIVQFNRLKKNNLNYFVVIGAVLILGAAASTFIVIQLQLRFPSFREYPSSLNFHVFAVIELLVFSIGLGYKSYKMEYEKAKLDRKLVNELLEKEKIKLKLDQTRNKIARDLHDDIGASISGIKILAGIGATETKNENVEQIFQITSELLEDFREAAWFLSEREDNLTTLMERVSTSWTPILNAQNITLKIKIDPNLVHFPLNLSQKKNIYLICKEAINNSSKYSGCTSVFISFSLVDNNHFSFEISDNGLYRMNHRNDSKGLDNISERIKELNGSVIFQLLADKNVTISSKIPV